MNYLKHSIFWLFLSTIIAWYGLSGCAYNQEYHKVFYLNEIKIHAVSDREFFDYPAARNSRLGWAGYARFPQNEIWILSKMDYKGRVCFDHLILGHEIAHILNWKYPDEIADPDNLFH